VPNRHLRFAATGLLLAGLLVAGFFVLPKASRGNTADSEQPADPEVGGELAVDAADGSLLLLRDGLFRSADQGQTWTPISVPDELHPENLSQLATTSAAPASLYAAGPGAGILRSDDNGTTWRMVSDGLPSQDVTAFAVHSFRPDTLYASIDGNDVFRTEDGGTKWEKMDEGPDTKVLALAHSTLEGSMNTGWLYAATMDGPYLSMDCF
jgi:photosystem II stability/assembly factor-like uncharacterized protein